MSTNVPISSVTLSEATSSITFSGIPQTYTDLFIVADGYNNTGDFYTTIIRFNGDSSSNYSRTRFVGDGSSPSNSRLTNQTGATINSGGGWGTNNNGSGNMLINIPNYSNTTTFKTILSRSNTAATAVELNLLTWRSTSAITSIEMFTNGATYRAGSTFNLYGINSQKSEQAKATGGDSIYRDSSYWYHIFNKSGTFTPSQSLSNVDYLVVAGGGGGGSWYYGGGGGAGGYRTSIGGSALTLNASTGYSVTVGAGGTGSTSYAVNGNGNDGSNSVFSTITSTGGGGGGGTDQNGRNGGSGGGSGGAGLAGSNSVYGTGGVGNSGSYSPSEGNSGGRGWTAQGDGAAGGGGGSGGVGGNAANATGGNGGAGTSNSISGSSITYAGGGGGSGYATTPGTGGSGGGGSATINGSGNAGTTNRGGGGGGGSSATGNGGNGGSGIIIVRYPV